MSKHVALWIDHKEARIFHIHPDTIDEETVMAPSHHLHSKHAKNGSDGKPRAEDAKRFFNEVARTLDGSKHVLVVGPSTAKLEFLRYVHKHDHGLETQIEGVETVDHPSDKQLVAYARKYFKLDPTLS